MKPDKKKQQELDDDAAVVETIRAIRRGPQSWNGGYPPVNETEAVQHETAPPHPTPSQPAKVPETYSVAQAAVFLKVTPATIYRLIQRGKLRYLKSLRHKRIPKTELARFMKEDLG